MTSSISAPRIPFHTDVKLKIPHLQLVSTQTSQNLSETGMCIQSDVSVQVGTALNLEFSVDDFSLPVCGVGEVVWTNSKPNTPEHISGMGIRFLEMTHESRQQLRHMIKSRLISTEYLDFSKDEELTELENFFTPADTSRSLNFLPAATIEEVSNNHSHLFTHSAFQSSPSSQKRHAPQNHRFLSILKPLSMKASGKKWLLILFAGILGNVALRQIAQYISSPQDARHSVTHKNMNSAPTLAPSAPISQQHLSAFKFQLNPLTTTQSHKTDSHLYQNELKILQSADSSEFATIQTGVEQNMNNREIHVNLKMDSSLAQQNNLSQNPHLSNFLSAMVASQIVAQLGTSMSETQQQTPQKLTETVTLLAPFVQTQPPANIPKSIAPAQNFQVKHIQWTEIGSVRKLQIVANKPWPENAFTFEKIRENTPRAIVKLPHISQSFNRDAIPVHSPSVKKLRIGSHFEQSPPQLHIVLDLKDPHLKMARAKVENNTLSIYFSKM